ncbi:MAG: 3-deoxy-D-manno-octulosonic acid transferase [Gemmatimonadaceae bacterium]
MTRWLQLYYGTAARVAELLAAAVPRNANSKLARTFSARRGIIGRYRDWSHVHRDCSRPLLWLHAASVGEALMALPVAERVKSAMPHVQLAFTFFSPSAENMAQNMARNSTVDFADYLPFDSKDSAHALLDALAPSVLVFTKGDVWPQLVGESARGGVRLALISASMPEQSRRTNGLASMLTRDAYGALDLVGAASEDDARALIMAGAHPGRVRVTGDTRYDQAWNRAHVARRNQDTVEALQSDRPTIVAGSTWSADETQLVPAFERLRTVVPNVRLIIAPHEVGAAHLDALASNVRKFMTRVSRLCSLDTRDGSSADVVIVDRVGILADLYALATVAYVGGGFHSAGLHSLVEPAVFRVPTIIGPRHSASRDAHMMLASGGAVAAHNSDAIFSAMQRLLTERDHRTFMADAMGCVVSSELGAADRSFQMLRELLRPVQEKPLHQMHAE